MTDERRICRNYKNMYLVYQINKYLNMNEQILASAAHASEVKFNGEEKILTTATFDILKILSYDAYQQFRENCKWLPTSGARENR